MSTVVINGDVVIEYTAEILISISIFWGSVRRNPKENKNF